MNITRISLAALAAACICIPAQAQLPTVTKPSVKLEKPAVTQDADGNVTIKKGGIKVEKPDIKMPEAPTKPEFKKPIIEKPSVDVEKPSITNDGDTIKIKKGGIKVNKGGIKLK